MASIRKENILQKEKRSRKQDNLKRTWYKFNRNKISTIGLVGILLIAFISIFANSLAPSPESAGMYINFDESTQPPSLTHIFGTDEMGRDVLSRVFFGYRISLFMVIMVLLISAPIGVILGLIAGYFSNTYIEIIIMRIADVFVAIPSLLLALVFCSLLPPNLITTMYAISLCYWAWYCRLVYSVTVSIKGEAYVWAAEISGAKYSDIIFKEILPNCLSPILTKLSLDAGMIILTTAALGFVGLGAQPPIPELGGMVASACKFLPEKWWIAAGPSLAIVFLVMCFNFVGDGIVSIYEKGR